MLNMSYVKSDHIFTHLARTSVRPSVRPPAGSDHYIHACCPYVRTFQNQTNKSLPAETVGPAEWIIDVLFSFRVK